MKKNEFIGFYDEVVKVLGSRFSEEYPEFHFCDNPHSLYEEYLNQKTLLRVLYGKEPMEEALLDRHKVCACMTAAIIKVRLLSSNISSDSGFSLSAASRINEQLAFMSVWELFKGFIILHQEDNKTYKLPDTYHNVSFLDTFTRSLFFANQLNSLSTPLIANIFYLLEKYCEMEDINNKLKAKITETKIEAEKNKHIK